MQIRAGGRCAGKWAAGVMVGMLTDTWLLHCARARICSAADLRSRSRGGGGGKGRCRSIQGARSCCHALAAVRAVSLSMTAGQPLIMSAGATQGAGAGGLAQGGASRVRGGLRRG